MDVLVFGWSDDAFAFTNGAKDVVMMAGEVVTLLLVGSLVARVCGKGSVKAQLLANPVFFICIGLALATTVLLATWMDMIISIMHAMVGSMMGISASVASDCWQDIRL